MSPFVDGGLSPDSGTSTGSGLWRGWGACARLLGDSSQSAAAVTPPGLCVGSGARRGGARGCSCHHRPRGSRCCSVSAGAEGRESDLGVASQSGPWATVLPKLGPSISRVLAARRRPSSIASSRPSTSMVVKFEAPGDARRQAASLAPSCSWGPSLAPAHGHLSRCLLSPAEPNPGSGRGRGSPAGAESSRVTTGTVGE